MRILDHLRGDPPHFSPLERYGFGVAAVAIALGVRLLLMPLTGLGAPFVLFFGATLVTSLVAGTGPALVCLALSLPIASFEFVLRAGYSISEAAAQASLYAVDGLIIVYTTTVIQRWRDSLKDANLQLQGVNKEREGSLTGIRETIELAPDSDFLADSEGRYISVNRAATELLGYTRDELIGKYGLELIVPEEEARLRAVGAELLASGGTSKDVWTLKRKDGTRVI